jgi:hypothetical protein
LLYSDHINLNKHLIKDHTAAVLSVPLSLALGLIGVAAKYLYPDMKTLFALPVFLQSMDLWAVGFVSVSLVASIFVGVRTSWSKFSVYNRC